MEQINQKVEQFDNLSIKPIVWAKRTVKKPFHVPWYGVLDIDIQTISNDALEKIITERQFFLTTIPDKKEVITIENQSEYYQNVKQQILNRLLNKKFAIIQWPTGTWKTTIVKTIWYEMQLPVYEVWADAEKSIDDFSKEIKTYKKWNMLQIKDIPWILIKAITQGGIFLVNEANTLSADIQIALANMLESGFVIVWTKKYLVHPNFSLVFTSNEDYAWTNPYNRAVIRKAWWIVNFDYEPNLEWEEKIVKTIYEKLQNKFNFDNKISEEDLAKITKFVRKFRMLTREHNRQASLNEKFLSQDLNDAWHFLYIRFYEKLLKQILSSSENTVNLQWIVFELFSSYLQDKIVGFSITWEYIDHTNNIEKLKELYYENLDEAFIYLQWEKEEEKKENLAEIDTDLLEQLTQMADKETVEWLKEFVNFSTFDEEKKKETTRKQAWFTKKWINPNLFSRVAKNEVKSAGEKLKRIEAIEQIAQDMYEKLVESNRKKVLWKIEIQEHEIYWQVILVEINHEPIIFKVKDWKKFDLSKIKTEKDVLENVFWNDDLQIVYKDYVFENVFSTPKSLEIRRFSKMIDYQNEVVFLWFRWEIRDVRYKWEESWKWYIPQDKVNDLLLSTYKVLPNDEIEKIKQWHLLMINGFWKLEFLTVSKIKERIKNWEELKVLKKQKNEKLEKEIRKRFANIDKLNLHNGAEERAETWLPAPVYGSAYELQRAIENELFKNFDYISSSVEKIIEKVMKNLDLWEPVLLIGPSWVWKSSIAKEVAKRKKLPYIDIQITDNLQESDLQTQLKWNEWELENSFSPFLDYWVNGGVIELKELNMASVLTFLHNFLDENGSIMINNKVYRKNPNCHIIATVNPFDNRIYSWTKLFNLATQARFTVINLEYLEKEEEKETLIEIAKIFNPSLLEQWLEKELENILNIVVYPIRKKIEELRLTQSMWTDEWLKILTEKNITIDIISRWLKTAKNIDDLWKFLQEHLKLEKEKKEILPDDIRWIFI